jgi:uncharacterized protein (DUF983 family)
MSSTLSNALRLKCPRCGKTDLFKDSNPYHFKTLFDMPRYCNHCGLDLENEPGYYFGAMYVSYMLTVGMIIINELWMFPLWKWNIWPQLIINALLIIILFPIIIRYSRSFYLALLFKLLKK